MTNVRKIGQTAKILSNFNFEDVSYCDVLFYFVTEDGKAYGSSINLYDEDFRQWGKKEWCERISDSARWYAERGFRPTHVASIIISFQDEIRDPLYTIEMTDLNGFDRVIIHSTPCLEAACTIGESSHIRGVRDVVKLMRKIPQARIKKASKTTPKVLLVTREDLYRPLLKEPIIHLLEESDSRRPIGFYSRPRFPLT